MAAAISASCKHRNHGNTFYELGLEESRAVEAKRHFCEAFKHYNLAFNNATNSTERLSALKNMALSSLRVGDLYTLSHLGTFTNTLEQGIFYYSESLKYFQRIIGEKEFNSQKREWQEGITTNMITTVKNATDFVVLNTDWSNKSIDYLNHLKRY